MNRNIFNLCCYGLALICFLIGIACLTTGHRHFGIILATVGLTLTIMFLTDRRRRFSFRTAKSAACQKQNQKLTVKCPQCGRENNFNQPYAYHSGFGDQGFLYSDSGHFTLTWSLYDPVIEKFFPAGSGYEHFPSAAACIPGSDVNSNKNIEMRHRFEESLRSAPDGGRWRFENPARCIHCSAPISGSPLETVYYLLYPGSFETQLPNGPMKLGEYLKDAVNA